MRLTAFSDCELRILMYTASAGGRLVTIEEAARTFNISKTHLNKVANTLTRSGYLKAIRGRSGGLILGAPARDDPGRRCRASNRAGFRTCGVLRSRKPLRADPVLQAFRYVWRSNGFMELGDCACLVVLSDKLAMTAFGNGRRAIIDRE
jgi:DNA-binding Lrp family transcriptional regulator